jgi:hypothetical protein
MESEKQIKCPNCFSPVIVDAESCPHCKIEFYNCSSCNAIVLETDKVCKNCNSDLAEEQISKADMQIINLRPMYEYKPLDIISNILMILFGLGIIFSVVNIYSDANDISFLSDNIDSGGVLYYDESKFQNIVVLIIQVLYLPVYIVSFVIYLIWVRRSYRNLHSLQLKQTEYSSGWAIGSYFVPILNLFRPYSIMKEIWFGSQPQYNLPDENEMEKVKRLTSTTFLKFWWTVFLMNWTVSNQSFRLSLKADTPQKLLTSYWVGIFSNLTGVILVLILIYLVSNVKIWQSEKIKSKPKGYCQHCGESVEIDALLCTNCGQQLIKSY